MERRIASRRVASHWIELGSILATRRGRTRCGALRTRFRVHKSSQAPRGAASRRVARQSDIIIIRHRPRRRYHPGRPWPPPESAPQDLKWWTCIKDTLNNSGFTEVWINPERIDQTAICKELQQRFTDQYIQRWTSELQSSTGKLRTYKIIKKDFKL